MENPFEKLSEAEFRNNWHRQIPTPTYRALIAADLSSADFKIILYIIDRTWGFQHDCCSLSRDKFSRALGLSLPSVNRSLKKLEEQRLIAVERIDGKTNKYLFNKYWDTWLVKLQGETSIKNDTSLDEGEEATSIESDTSDDGVYEGTSIKNDTSLDEFEGETSIKNDTRLVSKTIQGSIKNDTRLVSESAIEPVARKKSTLKKVRTKKVLKESTRSPVKRDIYGEFQNVQLSLDEFQKLQERFGEIDAKKLIEDLSIGIASHGYKYKSHYATILKWAKMNGGKGGHHEGHEREQSGAGGKSGWGDFKTEKYST